MNEVYECAVCATEVKELPDVQNGELLCEQCYVEHKDAIKDE